MGVTVKTVKLGGGGERITERVTVTVAYRGYIYDPENGCDDYKGRAFDSSYERGDFTFTVGKGKVVKGFETGILGMTIGEKRMITMDPSQAYGDHGFPGMIEPNSGLVFDVELKEITGLTTQIGPLTSLSYGCTFSDCCAIFPSKDQWKQHEKSMHIQDSYWRCKECACLFYIRSLFEDHVNKHHPKAAIRYCLSKIGGNGEEAFWCGFCKNIILLKKEGSEAWNERYCHIEAHFKDGWNIIDWVDVEGHQKKGEKLSPSQRAVYIQLALVKSLHA